MLLMVLQALTYVKWYYNNNNYYYYNVLLKLISLFCIVCKKYY